MKALNCKIKVIFLTCALAGMAVHAQEVKKTFSKEFKTNQSSVLSFDTNFCELNVDTWNKNTATFDVTVIAEHKDKEKAQKMLEYLTVEVIQKGNTITVTTDVDNKLGKGEWGKSKKFNFIINARIPADIAFELENNFGNVIISELTGEVSIENNYGSIAIQSLTGNSVELELNYGNIRIGSLANAEIELNYGSLDIQQADNLDIEVNFGDCTIKNARNVVAEVNMGDLEIREVSADFTLLELETSTGNIEVGLNKNAGFTLEGTINMGSIDVPPLENLVSRKSGMSKTVSGTYGNGKSVINLQGQMGSIDLYFN